MRLIKAACKALGFQFDYSLRVSIFLGGKGKGGVSLVKRRLMKVLSGIV